MTTHRLNILLAILGTIAGIFILALIHAGASPQPTAARHWIAPGIDRTGDIERHAPRG